MITKLLTLFEKKQDTTASQHTVELATAVLLYEVVNADHNIDDKELEVLLSVLRRQFTLDEDELAALAEHGRQHARDANDLVQFTRRLHAIFSYEQKIQALQGLWEVALADGHLDKHEEHMIRRIADLLYISHADFIKTKIKVKP